MVLGKTIHKNRLVGSNSYRQTVYSSSEASKTSVERLCLTVLMAVKSRGRCLENHSRFLQPFILIYDLFPVHNCIFFKYRVL